MTMSKTVQSRIDTLEGQVLNALWGRVKRKETPGLNYDTLNAQLVSLSGDNSYDNSRLLTISILLSSLRQDDEMLSVFCEEALKRLHGKDKPTTDGEACLYLGLFLTTGNVDFRRVGKDYVKQQEDVPPMLHALYSIAGMAQTRKLSRSSVDVTEQKKLITESSEVKVMVSHLDEVITNTLTDGQQDYRLVTIEKGIDNLPEFKRLKASRRDDLIPQHGDSTERLRCLGGMAVSRLDIEYLTTAFRLLSDRLSSASSTSELMTILDAMYHVAGCDSSLLVIPLKRQCDTLFDSYFFPEDFPKGLFPDEPDREALAYRLQFLRYMPLPGQQFFSQSSGATQWLNTLKSWADRLVEQEGGLWHGISLGADLCLRRYILQTGFLNIAHDDEYLAKRYRGYVVGSIFDSYLELARDDHPATHLLVSCYHLLREWKPNVDINEERYREFFRMVERPSSILEEIRMDYEYVCQYASGYKLVALNMGPEDKDYNVNI